MLRSKKLWPFLLVVMIALVDCSPESFEVTPNVAQEVEVEVTQLVEVEVTSITEIPVKSQPQIVGDPERGRDIFETGGGIMTFPCKNCHTLDGTIFRNRAPSLKGISAVAGNRVPGLSADEYLRQSLQDPSAFEVEGFDKTMDSYKYLLNEADLAAVVAFLLTQ